MRISREEQAAVCEVLCYGGKFGYGNLITHLQTAWAKMLMEEWGLDEEAARKAASGPGYPFKMQEDIVERGEWDETGERYRKVEA